MLSDLIKKRGLRSIMTATAATIATHESNEASTVAKVATVAVTVMPKKPPELTAEELVKLQAWLAYINEADPKIISELIEKCRTDKKTRCYFLHRSDQAGETVAINAYVTCNHCNHFKRIDHPHLGHCTENLNENAAGLWDIDPRYCEFFVPN
jgi:hypothetical protein